MVSKTELRHIDIITKLICESKFAAAKVNIKGHLNKSKDLQYFFYGWIEQLQGDDLNAISYFEKALAINPLNEDCLYGACSSYMNLNNIDNAIECAEQLMLIAQTDRNRLILGLCYAKLDVNLAYSVLSDALLFIEDNSPYLPDILSNLGAACLNLKNIEEAQKYLELANKVHPYDILTNKNLASVYILQNKLEQAKQCLNVVQMSGTSDAVADAKYQEGMIELLQENYVRGWRLHEFRLSSSSYKYADMIRGKRLNLESIRKQDSLLVYQEQGIGDTIQFLRYIPLLSKYCDNISIVLIPNQYHEWSDRTKEPSSLKSLVQFNYGKYLKNIFIRGYDTYSQYDYSASLMSLPYIFSEAGVDNIPNVVCLQTPVKHKLPSIKIGLVWRGSEHHFNDVNRSMPVEYINKLVKDNSNINFVTLQLDHLEGLESADNLYMPEKTEIDSIEKTMGILNNCIRVISVDSMIAHLSASMLKYTYIIHAYSPDWRWGLTRSDSIWYPTVKNIRQVSSGDWNSVIESIQQELNYIK
jgi:tetratricopeptide (TPR) repeat protein